MSISRVKGLPVAGYRAQWPEAVERVNANKEIEERVLRMLDELAVVGDDLGGNPQIDKDWLAIGRKQIEQGFMAVNRAVFQPGRIRLPGDGV